MSGSFTNLVNDLTKREILDLLQLKHSKYTTISICRGVRSFPSRWGGGQVVQF